MCQQGHVLKVTRAMEDIMGTWLNRGTPRVTATPQ